MPSTNQIPTRLLNYPGLSHKWPPPACNPAGEPVDLEHCSDRLASAFYEPSAGAGPMRIRMVTHHRGFFFLREIIDAEEAFAKVFCEFLNQRRGKTIREIGEMEVTFLG